LQIANGIHDLHQLFVSLGNRRAEFIAVDIDIVKQTFEVFFAGRTFCRIFNVLENTTERFVEVGIVFGVTAHIFEKLGGQYVKTLFLYGFASSEFGFLVGNACIVEVGISRPPFSFVNEGSEIFGYEAVKQHSQHVRFEIPSIDTASEVVGYLPYRAVKLVAFLFFGHYSEL
jgi:hypothetical protein